MLCEAFVKNKINDNTIECIVAFNSSSTRVQRFQISPRKQDKFLLEDILYTVIFIEIKPLEQAYGGTSTCKLIFIKDSKIYFINNALLSISSK